jgi:hypothetical protein
LTSILVTLFILNAMTNQTTDLNQIKLNRFRPYADTVPNGIHASWDAMTVEEQRLCVFYLRNWADTITRNGVASHAIGCFIKNNGTASNDQIEEIWASIV